MLKVYLIDILCFVYDHLQIKNRYKKKDRK